MNIAITGGGTGGHLAIAKALGEACQKKGINTIYIGGTKGQDKQWFDNESAPFLHTYFLDSTPVVNQGFFGKWRALAQNITESKKAKQILCEHKIDACISVGGFSAATGSFGAIMAKIPFFIHEQNACMGALNKLLKPFAKKFYASFPFSGATLTPYPINSAFFATQRVREKLETIAFFGGSQGAQAINTFALQIAPLLKEKNIQILHQAGKNDYERVLQEYRQNGFQTAHSLQDFKEQQSDVFVFDFSTQMPEIMNYADFCVSRSGASSLWELVSNGLPTLFVPYPHAAKNHQYFNAKSLLDSHLCLLYTQEYLQQNTQDIIERIMQINLAHISQSLLQQTTENGAEIIIENILECITQQK